MTSKQRIQRILAGEKADRIGKAEAPWPHVVRRWEAEGLPVGVHPTWYFDLDFGMDLDINCSFMLPEEKLDENEQFIVERDANGVVTKSWKDAHGVPHTLEYAINSRQDWLKYRDRLQDTPDRYIWGLYGDFFGTYQKITLQRLQGEMKTNPLIRDKAFILHTSDPYEAAMQKVGDETLLIWMAMEPDLVADMFEVHTNLVLAQMQTLYDAGIRFDALFIGGDIAYKNGLLFSPDMYRELILPRARRIFGCCHDCGMKVIYHSDGDCRQAIPLLIEAGIDCLQPMEVQAGMDVGELAQKYGKQLSFQGNVSVRQLSGTKDQAVAEARKKIRAGKNARGYIFHSDHSLPPSVPWENYKAIMEVFDEECAY